MTVLLASLVLAHQSNAYIDSGLPPDEYSTMSSVLANYPGDPGTAIYIDESGTVHSNRVGAAAKLVQWQPVDGQPGVYTDGTETSAAPTTGLVPPAVPMQTTDSTDSQASVREDQSNEPSDTESRSGIINLASARSLLPARAPRVPIAAFPCPVRSATATG